MQRWFDISKDPNCKEVMLWRKQQLVNARTGKLIADRVAYLASLARGKDVLDIGVVEHTRAAIDNPKWLHRHLVESAKSCLGVDILADEVEHLKTLGFNVVCADITTADLGRDFDLVVCGEVMEHLDQPGPFFAAAARLLRSGGRLAITVPNPWYINVVLKSLRNGAPYVDSSDHVSWFDPGAMCEIGQRAGLSLDRYAGVAVQADRNWRTRVFFGLRSAWVMAGVRPEAFAKAIVYEFVAS